MDIVVFTCLQFLLAGAGGDGDHVVHDGHTGADAQQTHIEGAEKQSRWQNTIGRA